MNQITLPVVGGTPAIGAATVTIRWQRFVGGQGGTCARCGSTETEVEQAAAQLKQSLAPLGITVTLELQALDTESFRRDVDASNRIWVNDRLLEDWLGAEVGASDCTFAAPRPAPTWGAEPWFTTGRRSRRSRPPSSSRLG